MRQIHRNLYATLNTATYKQIEDDEPKLWQLGIWFLTSIKISLPQRSLGWQRWHRWQWPKLILLLHKKMCSISCNRLIDKYWLPSRSHWQSPRRRASTACKTQRHAPVGQGSSFRSPKTFINKYAIEPTHMPDLALNYCEIWQPL